ncbi:MAG: HAD family hydrolase [Deltaproteobacteria bacterium]|nr:HAD family hydrolase [Deltaproteobacteria bacterium]
MDQTSIFKAAFFDVDGTLVDSRRRLSIHTVSALNRMRMRGIGKSLATGRSMISARYYAEAIEADLPLILFNGARVYDAKSREIIYEKLLPKDAAILATERARQLGLHVNLYIDEDLYVSQINEYALDFWEKDGLKPRPVGDLVAFIEKHKDPVKLLCIGSPDICDEFKRQMDKESNRTNVVRSEPNYVEVLGHDVNKGRALMEAVAACGMKISDVVVFGDGPNDVEMLEIAGLGVAPGNARPEAKRAADIVIGSNDSDDLGRSLIDIFKLGP